MIDEKSNYNAQEDDVIDEFYDDDPGLMFIHEMLKYDAERPKTLVSTIDKYLMLIKIYSHLHKLLTERKSEYTISVDDYFHTIVVISVITGYLKFGELLMQLYRRIKQYDTEIYVHPISDEKVEICIRLHEFFVEIEPDEYWDCDEE
jgi:hypothetical protein